ncbi:MAG: phospholipase [Gammaproteobacteria bacterium]|nr:phospholipase [Gammaproteobacteria bacterium]
MSEDSDELLDATLAVVAPLLTALDALSHTGRHLHPSHIEQLVEAMGQFRPPLAAGVEEFDAVAWPEHLSRFREHLVGAAGEALKALDALANCTTQSNPVMGAYRALGFNTRAVQELYPVSFMLPSVSRFFVSQGQRENDALFERLAAGDPTREEVGVMHANNAPTERGGFSMYVPEYYDPDQAWPLVISLHGGSGHGRSFLWTWLREARSRGVIVASPSSKEGTWSLMGPDVDSDHLDAIVEHVGKLWNIDHDRVLLTGMSDGGTFSYLSGLRDDAPFTHLAPISASFHPLLLEAASGERLQGLPIYLIHGALDWMFPVDIARVARDALVAAGANVSYHELQDLSHTYPTEENAKILDWLLA